MRKTVYVVDNNRLIRAASQSAAKAHTVRDMPVRVASKTDLESLLVAGVKIEEAGSEE